MQLIAGADVLFGVQMKPSLAALFLRAGVPGNRKSLNAPIREGNQVLLERMDSKSVFDLVVMKLAVPAIGRDEIFSVPGENLEITPK